jgi:putative flippase GtrA
MLVKDRESAQSAEQARPQSVTHRLRALLFDRSDAVGTQAARYIVVGAVATLADMSVLYVLTSGLHIKYLISASAGFIAGLVLNYILSINWVFCSRKLGNAFAEFAVFGVIGLIGLALTDLVMYAGVELLGLYYMLTKLTAVVIVFAWNFCVRRAMLFSNKREG